MSRVIAAFSQFFNGAGAPLANGFLHFLISGTTSADKNTYADVDQTIANANPVQLDGEGRCPNVFGQGVYKVVLYDINPVTGLPGTMIQTFDPVIADYQSEGAGGNFAEWDAGTLYQIGQIVIYNGLYYRSHIANNLGNQPDISTASWERIDFLRFWNLDVTYGLDDVAIYGSNIYFSLAVGNLNHRPDISPAWWDPVASGTILLNWIESGSSFVPVVNGYDLGSTGNLIGDIFQQDNARHYFGDSQDAYIYFDTTDFQIISPANLILGANGTSAWTITSAGAFVPASAYDMGTASDFVADIYQGTNYSHFFGDSQQVTLYFDGTDFNIDLSGNAWSLLAAGHLEPQTDASFDIGSASSGVRSVYITDDPTAADHAVRRGYIDTLPMSSFKNKFINPDFDFWQWGTSIAGPLTNGFAADRWICFDGSDGTASLSQQAFTIGQTDVPNNPKYFMRFNMSVAATGGIPGIHQRIEGVETLSGEDTIVSVWLKTTSGTVTATPQAKQDFGTGGSPSADVDTTASDITITTSWQRFDIAFSLPSISGKTLGSNGDDHLQVGFNLPLSSTYVVDIAQGQFEQGSIVTSFEKRPLPIEEILCNRYYWAPGNIKHTCGVVGLASNTYGQTIFFPTTMRTTPTFNYSSLVVIKAGVTQSVLNGVQVASSSPKLLFPYLNGEGFTDAGYMDFIATFNSEL